MFTSSHRMHHRCVTIAIIYIRRSWVVNLCIKKIGARCAEIGALLVWLWLVFSMNWRYIEHEQRVATSRVQPFWQQRRRQHKYIYKMQMSHIRFLAQNAFCARNMFGWCWFYYFFNNRMHYIASSNWFSGLFTIRALYDEYWIWLCASIQV